MKVEETIFNAVYTDINIKKLRMPNSTHFFGRVKRMTSFIEMCCRNKVSTYTHLISNQGGKTYFLNVTMKGSVQCNPPPSTQIEFLNTCSLSLMLGVNQQVAATFKIRAPRQTLLIFPEKRGSTENATSAKRGTLLKGRNERETK